MKAKKELWVIDGRDKTSFDPYTEVDLRRSGRQRVFDARELLTGGYINLTCTPIDLKEVVAAGISAVGLNWADLVESDKYKVRDGR